MKPLWYVEKDAFGWTINCRFMLGNQRASIGHLISPSQIEYGACKPAILASIIQQLNHRRDQFIAEEAA